MIHPGLTERLRRFAGTELAQAAFSRGSPPDFSRPRLLADLEAAARRVPPSPLRDRIFGPPAFLDLPGAGSRVAEWALSRHTLLEAMRGIAPERGELRYSFSHTEEAALAIAVASESGGVGVDLEREGREITDRAFARFHRPEELAWLADRLDHWVIKEAAFKAHPRAAETIVADYVVTGRGEREGEFVVLCVKGAPERFCASAGAVDGYRYAFARATG